MIIITVIIYNINNIKLCVCIRSTKIYFSKHTKVDYLISSIELPARFGVWPDALLVVEVEESESGSYYGEKKHKSTTVFIQSKLHSTQFTHYCAQNTSNFYYTDFWAILIHGATVSNAVRCNNVPISIPTHFDAFQYTGVSNSFLQIYLNVIIALTTHLTHFRPNANKSAVSLISFQ